MLRKIKLLGHLGKKFGKEYNMDVQSPAEAVRALCSQVKGFKDYLIGAGKEKKFKVFVGDVALQDFEKESNLVSEASDIIFAPVIKGGGGNGGITLGAVLVATAFLNFTVGGYILSNYGQAIVGATGAAMLFKGISKGLVPSTDSNVPSERDKDNDRSYLFNGAVNTAQQGQPIPIGYGRMRIGSQVVSASISTTQIPI